MDNNDKNFIRLDNGKKRNGWKIVAIIFIILTLLISGAGGFIGYKFMQQNGDVDKAKADVKAANDKLKKAEQDLEGQLSDVSTEIEEDLGKELVITEWGIKFTIPSGLDGVKYKMSSDGNAASFSTTTCSAEAALGILSKGGDGYMINFSSSDFDGVYYRYTMPQNASCDGSVAQTQLLMQMLYTIKKS
jgi:cell division protein FtsB